VKETPALPFHERLLSWWEANGRKDLPWQHPRTPYRVWISEIMLQQTQVATVIPYFDRWMQTFPTISSLAAASLDDVLSLWSGLGYYARARNLHKAATRCMEDFEGELPASAEMLSTLPGIGLSTANAIVSQSTGQPAAVLDGNVRRTLARHAAIEGWTGKAAVQKRLWKEAEDRLPEQRGADYTQAIMDLGALVCTRSSPSCDQCPVSVDCQALQQGQVELFPSPKPPTRVTDRTICMLVLKDSENRVLLEKRPPSGIWGGLWSLPEGDSIENIEETLGLTTSGLKALPEVEHRLSHMRMLIKPTIATVGSATRVKCSAEQNWFAPADQSELGLPKPVSDLLKKVNSGEYA
jgi:A/G-specific adenine glycosylase